MTPQEIREQAAQIIEQRGWCQGAYGAGQDRPCCIMGALMWAFQFYGGELREAEADIMDELGIKKTLEWWNDQPGRTQADVLRALRGSK